MGMIMKVIFSTIQTVKEDFTEPPQKEHSELKPIEPFINQLATVLESIRKREGYTFSNKQLYLDYKNFVTGRCKAVFLKDKDLRYIGKLCSRNKTAASDLLDHPEKLDRVRSTRN